MISSKKAYCLLAKQCKAEMSLFEVTPRIISNWLATKGINCSEKWLQSIKRGDITNVSTKNELWICDVCGEVSVEEKPLTVKPSCSPVNFITMRLK